METAETRCGRCGAANRAGARFCEACGAQLPDAPAPVIAAEGRRRAAAEGNGGAPLAAAPVGRPLRTESAEAFAPARRPDPAAANGPERRTSLSSATEARVIPTGATGAVRDEPSRDREHGAPTPAGVYFVRALLALAVGIVLLFLNRLDPTGTAAVFSMWAGYFALVMLVLGLIRLFVR